MRFMMIIKGNQDSEAGVLPSAELFAAMDRFNESMIKAGVFLAADGLHPTSRGARVRFAGGQRSVKDGPFTEAKELIAGFWIIQVKSKEEAIEWASRCPGANGELVPPGGAFELDLRQLYDLSDFPAELTEQAPALKAFRAGSGA